MVKMSRALKLAEGVHEGQKWKDGRRPFIYHPISVSALVLKYGGDDVQAAAALVHDTIGEPQGTLEALTAELGVDVARLAHAFADPELPPGERSWREIRTAYINKLRSLSAREILVIACEELHEITDLTDELGLHQASDVWGRYTSSPQDIRWYHQGVLSSAKAVFGEHTKAGEKSLVSAYEERLQRL